MTTTALPIRTGRSLVSAGDFEMLAGFCASEYGLERGRAERVVTDWYAAWCEREFGYFVHHQPGSKTRTRGLMDDVVRRLRVVGFAVDEELWGTTANCNPPGCCGDGPCC